MNKAKVAIAASAIALATPLIAKWEGEVLQPYYDIGGVLTVCFGETEGIEKGKTYTSAECSAMLEDRVPDYYYPAMLMVTRDDVPLEIQAAITSFSYNVGVTAFRKSTMLRKINKGDFFGACNELKRWTFVKGNFVQGLMNRRKEEMALCMKGVMGIGSVDPIEEEPKPEPKKNLLTRLAGYFKSLFN